MSRPMIPVLMLLAACGQTTLQDDVCVTEVTPVSDTEDAGVGITAAALVASYPAATETWDAWAFPNDIALWDQAGIPAPAATAWTGDITISLVRGAGSAELKEDNGKACIDKAPTLTVPVEVDIHSDDGTFALETTGTLSADSARSADHRLAIDLDLAGLGGSFAEVAADAETVLDATGCGASSASWVTIGTGLNFTGIEAEVYPDCEEVQRGVLVIKAS